MTESSGYRAGGLKLPPLNHIGVVVPNRDAAIRRYQEALGLGSFHTYDREFADARLRGKEQPCRLRIGFGNLGPVLFEVIEPLDEVSPHFEFLRDRGEGVQHLAFVVPDLAGDLGRLEANGLRLLWDAAVPGRGPGVSVAYIEGEAAGGVLFELIQDSPGTQEFFDRLWEATRG